MTLARLYGWDFWQVQALPAAYLDELFIALEIEREAAVASKETTEQKKAAKLAAMRRANLAILHKQGLRPLH